MGTTKTLEVRTGTSTNYTVVAELNADLYNVRPYYTGKDEPQGAASEWLAQQIWHEAWYQGATRFTVGKLTAKNGHGPCWITYAQPSTKALAGKGAPAPTTPVFDVNTAMDKLAADVQASRDALASFGLGDAAIDAAIAHKFGSRWEQAADYKRDYDVLVALVEDASANVAADEARLATSKQELADAQAMLASQLETLKSALA